MLTDSPISNADYVFYVISVVFKFLFGTFRPGTTSSLLHHKTGTVDQTQCVSSMEQSVVWRVKCVTVVQSKKVMGQGSHRCLSASRRTHNVAPTASKRGILAEYWYQSCL